MQQPISITSISSISPLGFDSNTIWKHYASGKHFFSKKHQRIVAKLSGKAKEEIQVLKSSNQKYKQLDDTVLFAIFTARRAIKQSGWTPNDNFGINIGSSRGATELFEKYHQDFLQRQKTRTLSSPTTTLGNISSWVAHDLQSKGPTLSHSITCSTALHAMLNGIAWLQSGMSNKFLVGGSEAPLTPFTLAQMEALKIYVDNQIDLAQSKLPCQALNLNKTKNTMILCEAAVSTGLEIGRKDKALAHIEGYGFGTELLDHNASLSTNAICFQRSMTMALKDINPKDIDVIVTHTPGTIKGDLAEYNAIQNVFGKNIPALTTNKTIIGHSLGASGLLSVEMAILMLNKQRFIDVTTLKQAKPKQISKIMVNAVGFGGNAVSIILSK